jgi:hypothetical protein
MEYFDALIPFSIGNSRFLPREFPFPPGGNCNRLVINVYQYTVWDSFFTSFKVYQVLVVYP